VNENIIVVVCESYNNGFGLISVLKESTKEVLKVITGTSGMQGVG
jgi:hypothetical protein